MTYHNHVGWVHVVDRKVLAVRFKNEERYCIPRGHCYRGEDEVVALVREMAHELSVRLERGTVENFGMFELQDSSMRLACYLAGYEGMITLSDNVEDVMWLGYADIVQVAPIDRLIFRELKARDLID